MGWHPPQDITHIPFASLCTRFVSLMIPFSTRIIQAYHHLNSLQRHLRMQRKWTEVGTPQFSGVFTTIKSTIPLFTNTLLPFVDDRARVVPVAGEVAGASALRALVCATPRNQSTKPVAGSVPEERFREIWLSLGSRRCSGRRHTTPRNQSTSAGSRLLRKGVHPLRPHLSSQSFRHLCNPSPSRFLFHLRLSPSPPISCFLPPPEP